MTRIDAKKKRLNEERINDASKTTETIEDTERNIAQSCRVEQSFVYKVEYLVEIRVCNALAYIWFKCGELFVELGKGDWRSVEFRGVYILSFNVYVGDFGIVERHFHRFLYGVDGEFYGVDALCYRNIVFFADAVNAILALS